jgi:hypothetical protein
VNCFTSASAYQGVKISIIGVSLMITDSKRRFSRRYQTTLAHLDPGGNTQRALNRHPYQ